VAKSWAMRESSVANGAPLAGTENKVVVAENIWIFRQKQSKQTRKNGITSMEEK
jgi:hypothetical protein